MDGWMDGREREAQSWIRVVQDKDKLCDFVKTALNVLV
jgi:hypothetical protein